jgi:putative ABC transport system ATP-binding protein
MSLVVARDLTRVHHGGDVETRALDGLSLEVARGEFVAITGPSGCGKTTLLNLLGGLDRPTSGELLLDGQPVHNLSEAAWAKLRRRSVGFVFQFFNLVPNLTVADNVELAGLLGGLSAREAARRSGELLAELGLEETRRAFPGRLSGGEQQRIALARAVINRPALLLADEPTGNLDSRTARDVLRLIRRFHDEGQTIVMVTHDQAIASQADRVVRLRDGRIATEVRLDDEPLLGVEV